MRFLHALRKKFLRRRTKTVRFHGLHSQSLPRLRERLKRRGVPWRFKQLGQKPLGKFLIALFVFFFIYGVFFSQTFEIQKIEIIGDLSVEKEKKEIQTFFEKQLGKNLVLFASLEEQKKIEKKYPSLKHIHLRKKPFHTLSVEIVSYQSIANIIIEDANSKSHRYVINEEGKINEENKHIDGLPLVFIQEVEGLPNLKSPGVIRQDVLQSILQAKESFENKFAMNVTQVNYKKRSREIHLETERNFSVWLDAEQDLEPQLNKLKLALSGLDIYQEALDYIDLRITGQDGEKVIYKLRPL